MMKAVVIGAGYVGLVTGVCLAEFGHHVTCIDIDSHRIAQLKEGKSPIFEPGIEPMITRNTMAQRLEFLATLDSAIVYGADVIFIAVSTPASDAGEADLRYLFAAVDQLITCLSSRVPIEPTVVTIKSTVPVGTNAIIQRRFNDAGLNGRVVVVSNPEFLREGAAISDCMNPDRIVIGSDVPEGLRRMKALYHPYIARKIPVLEVSLQAAEHIKYAANAFLATKISFINELALLCEATQTDVLEVAKGIGLDPRIGPAFLAPGPGFGGSCFPKDIRALDAVGNQNGVSMEMVKTVERINDRQKHHIVDQIRRRLDGVESPVIGVLGLAFKANTDDMRDAPSLTILPALIDRGAAIQAYDDVARHNAKRYFSDSITYVDSVVAAAKNADLLLILTEWNEFFDIDLNRLKSEMKRPIIVDARRVIDPEAAVMYGFNYYGIGRG